jgi:hypothetical protein
MEVILYMHTYMILYIHMQYCTLRHTKEHFDILLYTYQ